MKAITSAFSLLVLLFLSAGCDTQQVAGPDDNQLTSKRLLTAHEAGMLAPELIGSFTVGVYEEFEIGDLTGELTDIVVNEPDASGDCDITLYSFWYEDDVCGGSVNYAIYGQAAYGGTVHLGESKFRELALEPTSVENAGLIIQVQEITSDQATIVVWSYTGNTFTAANNAFTTYNLVPGDELRLTEGRLEFETIYWNGSAQLRYRERTNSTATNGVTIIKNEYRADKTFFEPSFEIGAVSVGSLSMEMDLLGSP